MKTIIVLGLCLASFLSSAQKINWNVGLRYGQGVALPPQFKLTDGSKFLTTEMFRHFNGKIINSSNTLEGNSLTNQMFGASAEVVFGGVNKPNKWGLELSGMFQNTSFKINYPSYLYNGYRRNASYYNDRIWSVAASVKRIFWTDRDINAYVQVGGQYTLSFQERNENGVWESIKNNQIGTSSRIQSGMGYSYNWYETNANPIYAMPAIGIRNRGRLIVDIRIMASIPILNAARKNEISFIQNNRIVGTQKTKTTAIPINITLGIGWGGRTKAVKKYQSEITSKTFDVPRYQDVCIKVIDLANQKPIANAQITVASQTYTADYNGEVKLAQMICCNGVKIKAMATGYADLNKQITPVYQTDCWPLNVYLTKNNTSKSKIGDKDIVMGKSIVLENIQFDQQKSYLTVKAKSELDKLAEWLQQNPTAVILLTGHTSSEGNTADNIRLSKERAEACKTYLVKEKYIIDGMTRIKTAGFGPNKPLSKTDPTKNRRVELLVEQM